jgi:hypothetical protein
MHIRGFLHRECDLMSNFWFCMVAAVVLLFSVGSAGAVDNTFPPVPKFGEPPPVVDFSSYPWLLAAPVRTGRRRLRLPAANRWRTRRHRHRQSELSRAILI